jgi:hypothetical protein
MPVGLIADSYFSKSHYAPEELFESIARLIENGPIRPHVEKADKAPVWIPRNASGYVVITCTECLRSFSVADTEVSKQRDEVGEISCEFCGKLVQFLTDLRPKQSMRQLQRNS